MEENLCAAGVLAVIVVGLCHLAGMGPHEVAQGVATLLRLVAVVVGRIA